MTALDVAIVGIGIHRFGRTEGMSGRAQGAAAARAALADAGIDWGRVGRERRYPRGLPAPRVPVDVGLVVGFEPMVNDPLTQYMFCSPGEGAAALVVCRADRAHQYTDRPVFLRAASFKTRRFGSFEVFSPWPSPERAESPTVEAARATFEDAGIDPQDVDVAQIQDTEVGAELMHMAETGLCKHGEQEALVLSGATAIGGALPINTDGGCIANGEPIGASGLRQVYESVLQLRGDAGPRQVQGDPRVAFTHVYGAPGVSACTVLTR